MVASSHVRAEPVLVVICDVCACGAFQGTHTKKYIFVTLLGSTDYGYLVRKLASLHGRKSNPNPKFLGTAEAYVICHIGPKFQISLIYAFIGCP